MDDDAPAHDRVRAIEADGVADEIGFGVTGCIGDEVAEITGVPLRIMGAAVFLIGGIEVIAG